MEHQVWFTALLNKLLGGAVTAVLDRLGPAFAPADRANPITDYIAMEILVILVILVAAAYLRSRLSVENPGGFQHVMEVVIEFVQNMADEIIGHDGRRYVAMIGTLGIFVGLCNLMGLIPSLKTPTAEIQVTLGCAVAAFLYYNFHGFRQHGIFGYPRHMSGPMLAIAVLMFPIELIGNVGRLLSLSVRLYANMLVGDILEGVFTQIVPVLVPAVFMALHVFVSLLQAYIFMLLPAIYISLAVSEEH